MAVIQGQGNSRWRKTASMLCFGCTGPQILAWCLVCQLCLMLLQPHYPPGSSVHEIFQARILEQLAMSYSRGSSGPRKQIRICCISCICTQILYHCTSWEAQLRHLSKDKFQWTCILSSSYSMKNIKIINLNCLFLGLSSNLFMLDNMLPPPPPNLHISAPLQHLEAVFHRSLTGSPVLFTRASKKH